MPTWIVDGESIVAEWFDVRVDSILAFFNGDDLVSMRRNWSTLDRSDDDQPEATPRLESPNLSRYRVVEIAIGEKGRTIKVKGGKYHKWGVPVDKSVIEEYFGEMVPLPYIPESPLYAFGVPEGEKNNIHLVLGFEPS